MKKTREQKRAEIIAREKIKKENRKPLVVYEQEDGTLHDENGDIIDLDEKSFQREPLIVGRTIFDKILAEAVNESDLVISDSLSLFLIICYFLKWSKISNIEEIKKVLIQQKYFSESFVIDEHFKLLHRLGLFIKTKDGLEINNVEDF